MRAGSDHGHILIRSLTEDASIACTNDGPTTIRFVFSDSKDGNMPASGGVTITPGHSTTILAGSMGASTTNRFLLAHDNDALTDEHYTAQL